MEDINPKATKKEIIDAYNALLEKYSQVENNKLLKDQKDTIVETKKNLTKNTPEDIFGMIEKLKIQFLKEIDNLSVNLKKNYEVLNDIESNINEYQDYLENTLGIKAKAESLYALVDTHKQKQFEFEQETISFQRKIQIEKENWYYEFEQIKKKELYEWELKKSDIKKKFDTDIQKKITEITDKEQKINLQIEEFEKIKNENIRLNQELETLAPKLSIEIETRLKKDFETDKTFLLKDFEIKEKVNQVEVENYKSKISELQKQNDSLQKMIESTSKKLEQLAEKVVDGRRPIVYSGKDEGK